MCYIIKFRATIFESIAITLWRPKNKITTPFRNEENFSLLRAHENRSGELYFQENPSELLSFRAGRNDCITSIRRSQGAI